MEEYQIFWKLEMEELSNDDSAGSFINVEDHEELYKRIYEEECWKIRQSCDMMRVGRLIGN